MEIYSLYDLNEFIRRVIALNFQQGLWIVAEIGQINHARGHFFLDLVQKGADANADIIAQSQAVLWAKDFWRLRGELGKELEEVLQEGLQVKLKVRVDFNERYGLKLQIEGVDTHYTFGQMELQRRQTLRTLRETGLLQRNGQLPLPAVLQRIAVVSSETAAGLQDFRQHLNQNAYGYRFSLLVFQTAMQGKNVETELPAALARIVQGQQSFDCVVIIRGGGARLDLTAFDGLEVCKAVAQMPIPVFTGIGHDVDETVLDQTAHTALKTPTAVADFLIQHNFYFENALLQRSEQLRHKAQQHLRLTTLELGRMETVLGRRSKEILRETDRNLARIATQMPVLIQKQFQKQEQHLLEMEKMLQILHPDSILKRGFSLTYFQGKLVTDKEQVPAGALLETHFLENSLFSVVTDLENNP